MAPNPDTTPRSPHTEGTDEQQVQTDQLTDRLRLLLAALGEDAVAGASDGYLTSTARPPRLRRQVGRVGTLFTGLADFYDRLERFYQDRYFGSDLWVCLWHLWSWRTLREIDTSKAATIAAMRASGSTHWLSRVEELSDEDFLFMILDAKPKYLPPRPFPSDEETERRSLRMEQEEREQRRLRARRAAVALTIGALVAAIIAQSRYACRPSDAA